MNPHICRACGKPIDEYALNLNLCLGCGDEESMPYKDAGLPYPPEPPVVKPDREEEEEVHHRIIEELRTEARHSEMIALAKSVGSIQPEHKPCPFCGSIRILKGERYFAICVDCGATGPERISSNIAKLFKDWNTRV